MSIRIATRTSDLALWQANTVKSALEQKGFQCELVPIESSGDMDLTQPIYAMGITGVFTKQLDAALLNNQADIAVHSLKDVPTLPAEGLIVAAALERGPYEDVLILKNTDSLKSLLGDLGVGVGVIATGSLRRKAQWLSKYPNHSIQPIRGNVPTRLKKFYEDNALDGIVFAKAGLERLGLLPIDAIVLDWMLPAPAQGIVGIMCRENDENSIKALNTINDWEAFFEGFAERQFLNRLMGGCSVPISAKAEISESNILFKGAVHSYDGSRNAHIEKNFDIAELEHAGKKAAEMLLENEPARKIIEEIRNTNPDEKNTGNQNAE